MASDTTVAFVEALGRQFPTVGSLLSHHREANDGVLPHVFLGADVCSFIDDAVQAGTVADKEVAQQIVKRLGRDFEDGDDEVRAVIAVSFLEGLLSPAEPAATIRSWLPDNLVKELKRMEEWRPT
jgi:hypothetical protein